MRWCAVVCHDRLFIRLAACVLRHPRRQQLVVAGSVKVVASCLQDALTDAGIFVESRQVRGDRRLAGMTKEQKVFCFHLKPEKAEGKEKTQITLQWDREADEDLWRTIVLPLAQLTPG